jgi:hypothetical protein
VQGESVNRPRQFDAGRRPRWDLLASLAVAFGIAEAVVVIHLRSFLDPNGDRFPLVGFPAHLLRPEQIREAATLVVLGAAAGLSMPSPSGRLAAWLCLFGAWDLVYYGALRLMIGWPRTLGDWDLLFLLPVPWLGPVYAPVAIAVTMVVAGGLVLRHEAHGASFRLRPWHLGLAALGGGLCISSFLHDLPPTALGPLPHRYPVERWIAGLALGLAAYAGAWSLNTRRPRPAVPAAAASSTAGATTGTGPAPRESRSPAPR